MSKKRTIPIRLSEALIHGLDLTGASAGISRQELIEALLLNSIDTMRVFIQLGRIEGQRRTLDSVEKTFKKAEK